MIGPHPALVEEVDNFTADSVRSHEARQSVQELRYCGRSYSRGEGDDGGRSVLQLRRVLLTAEFFRLFRVAASDDLSTDAFGSDPTPAKEACHAGDKSGDPALH